jgi:metal-responsive CopG/Arc/MetJ family transcriptional regulator
MRAKISLTDALIQAVDAWIKREEQIKNRK